MTMRPAARWNMSGKDALARAAANPTRAALTVFSWSVRTS
jgi:hypothetical protein